MKKIMTLLLAFMLLVSCIVNVSAARIGDVVNKTVYTDIVAKINGYDIASYNIDGYTVIVAEDLRNYGFNVEWREAERALYITKNKAAMSVNSSYTAMEIPASQLGKKANDVLYTDIRTYIEGEAVRSYNIGGKTVIYFDELRRYGAVSYNNSERMLSVILPWLYEKNVTLYAADGRTMTVRAADIEAYISVGWHIKPVKAPANTVQRTAYSKAYNTLYNVIISKGEYVGEESVSYLLNYEIEQINISFMTVSGIGMALGFNGLMDGMDVTVMFMIYEDGSDPDCIIRVLYDEEEIGRLIVRYENSKVKVLEAEPPLESSPEEMLASMLNIFDLMLEAEGVNVDLHTFGFIY
ncbi:MAG: hypothetical protein Q4G23_05355 [Clostridia bacterium]|nr:hypothetical protein [Clostridia bacterium]